MKNNRYTKELIILSFIFLASCTPIAKLITGVRNLKVYVPNEERVEYYKPFFETNKNKISIYTFKEYQGIQTAFDSLNVPRIFVENTMTDSIYVLNCYDDVAYDVENINNNKMGSIPIADKKEFSDYKKLMNTHAELTFTENEAEENDEWKVYLLNGTFLGKKMRKRTLPITSLKNLKEIVILDTSINEENGNEKEG